MMAFVWMDRDRRYITNCSSLAPGRPHVPQLWRQVDGDEARRVEVPILTPKACEVYNDTCAAIDKSNRHRQDTLKLQRKLETNNWATRVGTTILEIIFVDSWLVYRGATKTTEKQAKFYTLLAEELIDNTFDEHGIRRRRQGDGSSASPGAVNARTGEGRAGIQAHLTPTK
jgi:hypothetical protein